jgi:hypothetical protein
VGILPIKIFLLLPNAYVWYAESTAARLEPGGC